MTKYFLLIFIFSLSLFAETLDFEAIGVNNSYKDVGTYLGFVFTTNLDVIDTVDSNWNYGAVSGQFSVLNNNGGTGIITKQNGGTFSFQSLWTRSWGTSNQGTGKLIVGKLNGVTVGTISFSLTATWTMITANFENIDTLELQFGNHFLVDDIIVDAINIPEPSSLFFLAFSGLIIFLQKKKKLK